MYSGGTAGLRRVVAQRKVECEDAAAIELARDVDLATEQAGQLAADGQAEPGAAKAPAGGHVRLLKRLEDDGLLVRPDADPGVCDGESDDRLGVIERDAIGAPAAGHDVDRHLD